MSVLGWILIVFGFIFIYSPLGLLVVVFLLEATHDDIANLMAFLAYLLWPVTIVLLAAIWLHRKAAKAGNWLAAKFS